MKKVHSPPVNARYWTAILLASVFGTNAGDLYAHESGLGIGLGLTLLAAGAAAVFVAERFHRQPTELWYWAVILLIRTGATNIADWLAYRARVPALPLTLGLAALLALFGWGTHRARSTHAATDHTLPNTGASYWLAMLAAGVFGTVVGDLCEHAWGEGFAAVALTALFVLIAVTLGTRAWRLVAFYWVTVAVARTAGTAVGDWLAENKLVPIGLRVSTLVSGLLFLAVVLLWRGSRGSSSSSSAAAAGSFLFA